MGPVEQGSPNPNQPYTNEVNQHTPSGWCVYSKFAYREVVNPLRLYRGKDCIETFCNYIKEEVDRLYHMFPELPMCTFQIFGGWQGRRTSLLPPSLPPP